MILLEDNKDDRFIINKIDKNLNELALIIFNDGTHKIYIKSVIILASKMGNN